MSSIAAMWTGHGANSKDHAFSSRGVCRWGVIHINREMVLVIDASVMVLWMANGCGEDVETAAAACDEECSACSRSRKWAGGR